MYYDEDSGALSFLAGVLLGAVIGASMALLTAPQSGRKTRKRLIRAVSTAREGAVDRWDDLTGEVQDAVRAGRKRIRL
jgi:gas vesicle protein